MGTRQPGWVVSMMRQRRTLYEINSRKKMNERTGIESKDFRYIAATIEITYGMNTDVE